LYPEYKKNTQNAPRREKTIPHKKGQKIGTDFIKWIQPRRGPIVTGFRGMQIQTE
jgi:hypothetical protein